MIELIEHHDILDDRIDQVRRILAEGSGAAADDLSWRVAASTVQLGLIARLIAFALGWSALTGSAPTTNLTDLYWQATLGGPYPLSAPQQKLPSTRRPDVDTARDVAQWLATGPVNNITDAVATRGSISARVLSGNIASAVHSAAALIATTRPDLHAATALATAITANGTLASAGRVRSSGQFQRHSCCLIYQAAPVPHAAANRTVCPDCVLQPP